MDSGGGILVAAVTFARHEAGQLFSWGAMLVISVTSPISSGTPQDTGKTTFIEKQEILQHVLTEKQKAYRCGDNIFKWNFSFFFPKF